jgi:hypothetical protein
MHIPVGTQTSAVAKDTRRYRCRACGHERRAEVVGVGTGVQSFLNARGTATARARDDAQREIKRTLTFAKCPACKRRSGYMAFLGRYFWMAGFFIATGVVMGFAPTWFDINMRESDKALCRTWVTGATVAATLVFTSLGVWWRWAVNDGRVRWLDD